MSVDRRDLRMTDNRIAEIKQRAENGLMDVASQISRGDYSLGLIKARQVMEQIVRGYAKNYNLEYTDLAGTIESLYKANAISNEDRENLHTIRQLGNMAVQESYNDAQDAERSYYLLKHEIELYLSYLLNLLNTEVRAQAEAFNREAVRETKNVETARANTDSVKGSPLRNMEQQGIDLPDIGQRERKNSSNRSMQTKRTAAQGKQRNNRSDRNKTVRNDQRGGQHRGTRDSGNSVNVTDVLKILIPIFCIILLIILINSIIPKKPKETETQTTPVVTTEASLPETSETETEPTEPETEAKLRYKVSADTVNARYADNQDRIYEQLSKGTEIGEVEEIEGSDFVKFERDGITLVVNKNYIEPIEE